MGWTKSLRCLAVGSGAIDLALVKEMLPNTDGPLEADGLMVAEIDKHR